MEKASGEENGRGRKERGGKKARGRGKGKKIRCIVSAITKIHQQNHLNLQAEFSREVALDVWIDASKHSH